MFTEIRTSKQPRSHPETRGSRTNRHSPHGSQERTTTTPSKNTQASPHTETERLVSFFDEFAFLSSREHRKQLVTHQLSALLKEYVRLPFHSYALTLTPNPSGTPVLHDHLYAHANLLQYCEQAISQATSTAQKERFTLEKNQVQQLLESLQVVLQEVPQFAGAALDLIATGTNRSQELHSPQHLLQTLQQAGWQASTTALSPDQARLLNVPVSTQVLRGPQFFYIMPQSAVHDGEMSMYLLAQVAYIPATRAWTVLQEQLFSSIPWEQHDRALTTAQALSHTEAVIEAPNPNTKNPQKPLAGAAISGTIISEAAIMEQCVLLPPSTWAQSPRDLLLSLALAGTDAHNTTVADRIALGQAEALRKYLPLEASVALHAEYLLQIYDLETAWAADAALEETTLNTTDASKTERLYQAFFNTLSSLYHLEPISAEQVATWVSQYRARYSTAESRSNAHVFRDEARKAASVSAPWLLNGITSKIECFSFSALKLDALQSPASSFSLSAGNPLSGLSLSERLELSATLNSYKPLKLANGETWYIPAEHYQEYLAGCAVQNGVAVGPCGVPLAQDNLVLSSEAYQNLISLSADSLESSLIEQKSAVLKSLSHTLTPEQQQEASELLSKVEALVVRPSLSLQQFLLGEVLNPMMLFDFPELRAFYTRILTSSDPLTELRSAVFELTQNPSLAMM